MPWLAFRQAPLAGVLRLEWPSRQAPLPLAGALSPWLEYFVLEWLQRNHGGPWRSPGKPCRGMLRLSVHKFGILGYPYSSTPIVLDVLYALICYFIVTHQSFLFNFLQKLCWS